MNDAGRQSSEFMDRIYGSLTACMSGTYTRNSVNRFNTTAE